MIALKIDDKRLQDRVKASGQRINKGMALDLRLSAKRAAFYCMEYTLPVSNGANPWPVDNFRARVEDDVKRAYPSKADPNWQSSAYKLIKDKYPEEAAKEFWNAYKSGAQSNFNPDAPDVLDYEQQFDRMRKVNRKIEPTAYADLRKRRTITRKRARQLAPDVAPLAFVSDGTRRAFIRKRQDTIGLAKAGWYAVDSTLGGQRNFKRAGNEAGRFIWPAQLRKLQSKFGRGIGSGVVQPTANGGTWSINNAVRYSDEAIPGQLRDKAFELGRNAMRIIFELRFKNRKTYAAP